MTGIKTMTIDMVRRMGGRRIIGMMIIPFLIIAMFGASFETGSTKEIPVLVVNLDAGYENASIAESIIANMMTRDTIDISESYGPGDIATDPAAFASDGVRDGEFLAAIFFSNNFSLDVLSAIASTADGNISLPGSFVVMVDGSNPMAKGAVLGDVQLAVQTVMGVQYHVGLPAQVVPEVYCSQDVDQRDFMAPGIIGVVVFFVAFLPAMTGQTGIQAPGRDEDGDGTTARDGLFGRAGPLALTGMLQASVVLGTMLLFPVDNEGSVALVLLLLMLLVLASNGLGMLAAALARNDFKRLLPVIPLIMFAAILLSGIIIPLKAIPSYLTPVSYMFPLTYAIDACRSVMLRGWGAADVSVDIAALVTYACVTYAAAYLVQKRNPR